MTLTELADKYGTDKGTIFHNYTEDYERIFAPLRDRPVRLLEIGILEGASLRMWAEWFPKGQIVGLDIRPYLVRHPRIDTICDDIRDWLPFGLGWLDIVVDDGPHDPWAVAVAFAKLWRHVNPGGFYCVEDVEESATVIRTLFRCAPDVADWYSIGQLWIAQKKEDES